MKAKRLNVEIDEEMYNEIMKVKPVDMYRSFYYTCLMLTGYMVYKDSNEQKTFEEGNRYDKNKLERSI